MENFNSFIKKQECLLEATRHGAVNKSGKSSSSSQDASGKVASMHGSTVKFTAPQLDFRNPFTEKLAYNFTEFLSRFEPLSNRVMNKIDKQSLIKSLEQLRTVDPKRADSIMREVSKIPTLPASADRTRRVQQIVKELGGFNTELQRGSRSYESVQPINSPNFPRMRK